MTTLNLLYRPSRGAKEKGGSVFIRLIHQRKNRTITVAKDVQPQEWDRKKQCILLPDKKDRRYTCLQSKAQSIHRAVKAIYEIIDTLEQQGYYTVDTIVEKYHLTTENGTLLNYAEKLAKELERANQSRTAEAYRTCTTGLLRYSGNRKLKLTDINAILIRNFEIDLRSLGKAPNTISYYMRNLRAIYNKAVSEKQIREKEPKPFQNVLFPRSTTTRMWISSDYSWKGTHHRTAITPRMNGCLKIVPVPWQIIS